MNLGRCLLGSHVVFFAAEKSLPPFSFFALAKLENIMYNII